MLSISDGFLSKFVPNLYKWVGHVLHWSLITSTVILVFFHQKTITRKWTPQLSLCGVLMVHFNSRKAGYFVSDISGQQSGQRQDDQTSNIHTLQICVRKWVLRWDFLLLDVSL